VLVLTFVFATFALTFRLALVSRVFALVLAFRLLVEGQTQRNEDGGHADTDNQDRQVDHRAPTRSRWTAFAERPAAASTVAVVAVAAAVKVAE
jgi:hypothetical protein